MTTKEITMTRKEILLDMAKTIQNGWCQQSWAETTEHHCDPWNEEAVKWCLIGAAGKIQGHWYPFDNKLRDALEAVKQEIRRDSVYVCLPDWNDAPGRTKQDVVDMLLKVAYEGEDPMEAFQAEREAAIA